MELDLQGNIEKFTLPEIFQLIAIGRKSGTLGIQRDDYIVMVYFDKGDITYGYGPRQTFHLGQLLRECGKLTKSQLDEAVATQARSDNSRRLGEILVNKGFIDRSDLEKVVTRQVQELLYSLLSWQSGSFKFYENQFPTEEEITVRLSVENVILEGLRRLDEMNFIRETLPDLEAVFSMSSSEPGRTRAVTLESEEWNVMALVDGYRTVNQICQDCTLPEDNTLRTLAKLKLAGIIVPSAMRRAMTTSHTPSPQFDSMVNRLASLFEEYLGAKTPEVNRIRTTMIHESETEQ